MALYKANLQVFLCLFFLITLIKVSHNHVLYLFLQTNELINDDASRKISGGSRTAATSKMELFLIIVNGFHLHLGCCSSLRSVSENFAYLKITSYLSIKKLIFFVVKHFGSKLFFVKIICSDIFELPLVFFQPPSLKRRKVRAKKCSASHTKCCSTFSGTSHAHKMPRKDKQT